MYTFTGDLGARSVIGLQKTKLMQKGTIINPRENHKLYREGRVTIVYCVTQL